MRSELPSKQSCTLSVKVYALDDDLLVVKAAGSRPDDSGHCIVFGEELPLTYTHVARMIRQKLRSQDSIDEVVTRLRPLEFGLFN